MSAELEAKEESNTMTDDETDSTVTLGDVAFDPVATQDFRLSVEGTSGTGKSNTLAVILEKLADTNIPTLIIERLGALSPVRLEDESIVVVGARDEEGVDLAVGLEDLDQLGGWVLDRGMKVLLDVSTYADYEAEKSRVHLAAAKAIRSLNDRAHEKYRSGDRTKSLLVVDEAHILAPKDSAPEPELDEWVKRCRGQLIKASTEGGNKGVSIIVGYQRRAFLHNGVIQLAQDFVAHRPGDEDIDRTADALRCSEDELAALGTGEVLARGATITGDDLVGPTSVRKRRSPDPREESFELPETPDELSAVLDDIQSEVEAERERRSEREDELEQLREENDRLQERVEELEQELADTDRLASALENFGAESNGGSAAQDVGEGVADLRERVDELKAERDAVLDERDAAEAEADELREENRALEEDLADVEADVQELRSAFEAAASDVASLAETFEVDVDVAAAAGAAESEETADLRARLQNAQERIDDLQAKNERLCEQSDGDVVEPLADYEAFLNDEAVSAAIDAAKEDATCSPRYIKGVLATIISEGSWVPYSDVAERLGVSTTSDVSKAASELERRKVIQKDKRNGEMHVDLNVDGLNEVRRAAREREKTEELMDEL
jgi:predicted nuclease with TOPRIM domain